MKIFTAILMLCMSLSSQALERKLEIHANAANFHLGEQGSYISYLLPYLEKIQIALELKGDEVNVTRIKSIKFIFIDHKPVTITNFVESGLAQYIAYSPFLIFKHAKFEVSYIMGSISMSIKVLDGFNGEEGLLSQSSMITGLKDITHNPVADVLTTKLNSKRVSVKLRKYPVTDGPIIYDSKLSFIMEVAGHGFEDYELMIPLDIQSYDQISESDVAISLSSEQVQDVNGNSALQITAKYKVGGEYRLHMQTINPFEPTPI